MDEPELLTDLHPDDRALIAKALRVAFRRGFAAGQQSEEVRFDQMLSRHLSVKGLNGTTELLKHEWREEQHKRDHGKFAPKGGGEHDTGSGQPRLSALSASGADSQRTSGNQTDKTDNPPPIPDDHLLDGLHADIPAGLWSTVKDKVLKSAQAVHERLVLATPAFLKLQHVLTTLFDHPDDLKGFGYRPTTSGVAGHETPDAFRDATGVGGTLGARLVSHVLARVVHWMRKGSGVGKAVDESDSDPYLVLGSAIADSLAILAAEFGGDAPDAETVTAGLRALGDAEPASALPVDTLGKGFDPNEARDEGGKWTTGAGHGKAGDSHPLAKVPHGEKRKELGRLSAKGYNFEDDDPMKFGDTSKPPATHSDELEADIRGVVARHAEAVSVGPALDALYAAVGPKHGLTKRQFQEVLAHLHDKGALKLSGWSKTIDEVPDPELATILPRASGRVSYYAHPTANATEQPDAKLGDTSLNTDHPTVREKFGGRKGDTATSATPVPVQPPASEPDRNAALYARMVADGEHAQARYLVATVARMRKVPKEQVQKEFESAIGKAWNADEHPRGDDGRFIDAHDLHAAQSDPAKAAELRKRVTKPEERKKLDEAIGAEPNGEQAASSAKPDPYAAAAEEEKRRELAAQERERTAIPGDHIEVDMAAPGMAGSLGKKVKMVGRVTQIDADERGNPIYGISYTDAKGKPRLAWVNSKHDKWRHEGRKEWNGGAAIGEPTPAPAPSPPPAAPQPKTEAAAKPAPAATIASLQQHLERAKTEPASVAKDADAIVAKLQADHTPAEILAIANEVSGGSATKPTPANVKAALKKIHNDLTAVARALESQKV